jgi:hypothetical protein
MMMEMEMDSVNKDQPDDSPSFIDIGQWKCAYKVAIWLWSQGRISRAGVFSTFLLP